MRGEVDAQVLRLAEYRLARRAADALTAVMHSPAWLVRVFVAVGADGEPVVVAVVTKPDRHILRCFPRSIDGVRVVVRGVANSDAEARE
jgi:hypothetical protein